MNGQRSHTRRRLRHHGGEPLKLWLWPVFTLLLVVFVIAAPAHYPSQGNWLLGWIGAVLAYVVEAVIFVCAIIAAVNRVRARSLPRG
jgi:hypothetical protein